MNTVQKIVLEIVLIMFILFLQPVDLFSHWLFDDYKIDLGILQIFLLCFFTCTNAMYHGTLLVEKGSRLLGHQIFKTKSFLLLRIWEIYLNILWFRSMGTSVLLLMLSAWPSICNLGPLNSPPWQRGTLLIDPVGPLYPLETLDVPLDPSTPPSSLDLLGPLNVPFGHLDAQGVPLTLSDVPLDSLGPP